MLCELPSTMYAGANCELPDTCRWPQTDTAPRSKPLLVLQPHQQRAHHLHPAKKKLPRTRNRPQPRLDLQSNHKLRSPGMQNAKRKVPHGNPKRTAPSQKSRPHPNSYMVGFQNVFSQNGALVAIPWGPASKSPLNFNHTQTTGMLNMKACELQKL